MAAIRQYVHFSDTPREDGLCPTCHNPALKRFTLQRINLDGITLLGERVACTDCKTWIGPLEEFPAHDQAH